MGELNQRNCWTKYQQKNNKVQIIFLTFLWHIVFQAPHIHTITRSIIQEKPEKQYRSYQHYLIDTNTIFQFPSNNTKKAQTYIHTNTLYRIHNIRQQRELCYFNCIYSFPRIRNSYYYSNSLIKTNWNSFHHFELHIDEKKWNSCLIII